MITGHCDGLDEVSQTGLCIRTVGPQLVDCLERLRRCRLTRSMSLGEAGLESLQPCSIYRSPFLVPVCGWRWDLSTSYSVYPLPYLTCHNRLSPSETVSLRKLLPKLLLVMVLYHSDRDSYCRYSKMVQSVGKSTCCPNLATLVVWVRPALLNTHHQGQLSHAAWPRSRANSPSRRQGWLTYAHASRGGVVHILQCCSWQGAGPVLPSHALRATSPTPPQQGEGVGPTLLHLCHQDQLYCTAQARGGAGSGQPLDINMAPGSSLDQGHLHDH